MKKKYIIPSIRIDYPKMRICHTVNSYVQKEKSYGNTVED